MQVLEAAVAVNPWPLRRERAAELAERYPHAAEMLRLYQTLTVAQEEGSFPPPRAGEGQGGGLSTHCPNCGGLPQLSYFAVSGEALVSGPRYLVCSRCATNWVFSRMMCASCGESNGTKLPIYQEHEQFPHARVDGCQTCRKYLLTFDLRRDTRAVPVVDEIASLPLDLYARDQGLTKITPNLMGN